jgi:hypothetical protein
MPKATFIVILILMSVVFILIGLTSFESPWFDPDYQGGKRFKIDNAMGATANALEFMIRHSSNNAAQWFTLALLCWLIASVERLRHAVERGIGRVDRT